MVQFFVSSYSNQLPPWSWRFWPLLSWKIGSESYAGKTCTIHVQNSSEYSTYVYIYIYLYIHRQSQTHTYIIYLSSFNSKMVMWNCMQDDYYTNNHLNLCSQKNFNKTTHTKQFRVNTFYATCRIMIISNMPFCGSDRSKCNWIKLLRWWSIWILVLTWLVTFWTQKGAVPVVSGYRNKVIEVVSQFLGTITHNYCYPHLQHFNTFYTYTPNHPWK